MHEEVPLKYYDIADEYSTESAEPVSESEREPLARYFQLLITRLMNNEEISEEAQGEDGQYKRASIGSATMISRYS